MVEDQSTVQKVSFIGRYVRHIRPVGDLAPAVFAEAWVLPIFPVNWQVSKDLRAKNTTRSLSQGPINDGDELT